MTVRFGGRYSVDASVMCNAAPLAVEELMRDLVRNASPNWETLHIECHRAATFGAWTLTLRAEGLPRELGGDGRG